MGSRIGPATAPDDESAARVSATTQKLAVPANASTPTSLIMHRPRKRVNDFRGLPPLSGRSAHRRPGQQMTGICACFTFISPPNGVCSPGTTRQAVRRCCYPPTVPAVRHPDEYRTLRRTRRAELQPPPVLCCGTSVKDCVCHDSRSGPPQFDACILPQRTGPVKHNPARADNNRLQESAGGKKGKTERSGFEPEVGVYPLQRFSKPSP